MVTHLTGVVDNLVLGGVHVEGAHARNMGEHAQGGEALDTLEVKTRGI